MCSQEWVMQAGTVRRLDPKLLQPRGAPKGPPVQRHPRVGVLPVAARLRWPQVRDLRRQGTRTGVRPGMKQLLGEWWGTGPGACPDTARRPQTAASAGGDVSL
jgi:hypothetical protein